MRNECESCGYDKNLEEYDHRRNQYRNDVTEESKKITLCLLCASTAAGTMTQYPEQCDELRTLQTLCYIGNLILERLPKT